MNEYTKSGWRILRDYTEGLKRLDELAIYLSKQTDAKALNSLKLLILAHNKRFNKKDFDIHAIQKTKVSDDRGEREEQETVVSNLLQNPQHLALELLDMIVHTHPIDFQLYPNKLSFWLWFRGFARIDYANEKFYKRYDMVDSKLQLLDFLIENKFLDQDQIKCVSSTLNVCIEEKFSYSEAQLLKMERLHQRMNYNIFFHEWLAQNIPSDEKQETKPDAKFKVLEDAQTRLSNEYNNLNLRNDECRYMVQTIPVLQKKKIIK